MRALSDQVRNINITGMFMPWNRDRPVMIRIEGQLFVPIYSAEDKLHASMLECGWRADYTIKQILDGRDFLNSLTEQGLPVCLDPHHVGEVTRFTRCL